MANRTNGVRIFWRVIALAIAFSATIHAAPVPEVTLYDSNPNHLWNRLHRALFVRVDRDGTVYGVDELDPLLWLRTEHLLQGQSFQAAKQVLDEFSATRGEKLISNPIKRAILQRDLWSLFHWASDDWGTQSEKEARRALQTRLAKIIPRIALNRQQIKALPDNYVQAAKSALFASEFDPKNPKKPFLPAELFSTNGDWVCVGINGSESIAKAHRNQFGGRSVFLVFMRTPGGRKETIAYLDTLSKFWQPSNKDLPQFPNGTTFALVRQAVLIDADGQLIASPITESIQIRRYLDVTRHRRDSPPDVPTQATYEFVFSRRELFNSPGHSLRPADRNGRHFTHFMSKGFDPFEDSLKNNEPLASFLTKTFDCMECHSAAGVASANSLTGMFQAPSLFLPAFGETLLDREREKTIDFAKQQFTWGLLQRLQRQ